MSLQVRNTSSLVSRDILGKLKAESRELMLKIKQYHTTVESRDF